MSTYSAIQAGGVLLPTVPPTSGGLVASLSKWSVADGKELPLIPDGRSRQGFLSEGVWVNRFLTMTLL